MPPLFRKSTLLLATALACSPGQTSTGTAPAVRDSAGVTIVENTAPARAVWRVIDALPALDLGGGAGSVSEFTRVAGVALLADGGLAVADGGTQDIRLFGPDGTWLMTVGRRGGGPGEFSRIGRLQVLAGDTLVVFDQQLRRVSVFSPTGALVREAALTMPGFPRVLGVLADGRMFAALRMTGAAQLVSGVQRDTFALALIDPAGSTADTLQVVPGNEMRLDIPSGPGSAGTMVRIFSVPFGRTLITELAGEQLAYGTGDRYEIGLLDSGGRLASIVRRPAPVVAPTTEDLDRFVDAMAAGMIQASEEDRAGLRRSLRETPLPASMPAHGRVVADDAGHLWVEEYRYNGDERPPRWSVFDREGRWEGDVALPPRFTLHAARHSLIAGVWRDEDDVEHVRVYRMK